MAKVYLICLLLCSLLTPAWAVESSFPTVVVSIKPLHSLVAGVMQGVGAPLLLVKGGGSPHGYVLRPSEARALSRAQLVVWVGEDLESFLQKPLATLAKRAQQLKLSDLLQDDLLVKQQGGNWDGRAHQHSREGEHVDPNSRYQSADLHLWLDPALAKQIVILTSNRLSEIDPVHSSQYRTNTTALVTKLDQLDQSLKQQLAAVKDTPYIVFHAAYQYFESAYGLNAVGSITIDPERTPGAKRIKEIRQKIKQLGARCVFSEPQFESRLIATVIEGTEAKTGILDPLGADLPAGPGAYFQLMTQLADNLLAGLTPDP